MIRQNAVRHCRLLPAPRCSPRPPVRAQARPRRRGKPFKRDRGRRLRFALGDDVPARRAHAGDREGRADAAASRPTARSRQTVGDAHGRFGRAGRADGRRARARLRDQPARLFQLFGGGRGRQGRRRSRAARCVRTARRRAARRDRGDVPRAAVRRGQRPLFGPHRLLARRQIPVLHQWRAPEVHPGAGSRRRRSARCCA